MNFVDKNRSSAELRAVGGAAPPLGEAMVKLLQASALIAGAGEALALIWAPAGEDLYLVIDAVYGVGCVREELAHVVALLREELARG